jgi:hypothetical protein
LLLAIPVSCLPKAWRARYEDQGLPIAGGTMLSGLIEIVLAAIVGAIFVEWITPGTESASPGGAMVQGLFYTPAIVFLAEGMIRVGAAWAGADNPGLFLLWLLERATRIAHGATEAARPTALARTDLVRRQGEELTVSSDRKHDWDELTAFRKDGAYYCLAARETQPGPRPHLYRLRLIPDNFVVRRIVDL